MQERVQREGAAEAFESGHPNSGTGMGQGQNGVPFSPEAIDLYLEHLQGKGRNQTTIENYRKKLNRLYQKLPKEDKAIHRETPQFWREALAADGCGAKTINIFMTAVNGYLAYMGAREFQMADRLDPPDGPQPELTRNEYLRMLSMARSLGQKQTYLLVKVFGNSDLQLQELRNVTVEAVQAGMLSSTGSGRKRIVRFPRCLCQELLDYARGRGIRSGPIFLSRRGGPLSRSNVTAAISRLCGPAQVAEEKGNPRCLHKLYQSTRDDIERNIALLVERAHNRLLEDEQLTIGWDI